MPIPLLLAPLDSKTQRQLCCKDSPKLGLPTTNHLKPGHVLDYHGSTLLYLLCRILDMIVVEALFRIPKYNKMNFLLIKRSAFYEKNLP